MDPLDLQSLGGGTGGAAQSLMLLDLNVQRRLRCDGGLGCLGGLLLQPCAKTSGMGLSTKGNKPNRDEGL